MKNEYKETINKALNSNITIWWWNFGKKTLDFKGTYKGYLEKRGIKIKEINLKDKHYCNITFNCGCANFKIQIYGNYFIDILDTAIKVFLTYLGDKTLFEGYNRTYKLNWR